MKIDERRATVQFFKYWREGRVARIPPIVIREQRHAIGMQGSKRALKLAQAFILGWQGQGCKKTKPVRMRLGLRRGIIVPVPRNLCGLFCIPEPHARGRDRGDCEIDSVFIHDVERPLRRPAR